MDYNLNQQIHHYSSIVHLFIHFVDFIVFLSSFIISLLDWLIFFCKLFDSISSKKNFSESLNIEWHGFPHIKQKPSQQPIYIIFILFNIIMFNLESIKSKYRNVRFDIIGIALLIIGLLIMYYGFIIYNGYIDILGILITSFARGPPIKGNMPKKPQIGMKMVIVGSIFSGIGILGMTIEKSKKLILKK